MHTIDKNRRRYLQWIGVTSGLMVLPRTHAHHTETHFEDKSEHQIVFQCDKVDPDYLNHTLFSVEELIRKYGDNVEIVIVCLGKGVHLVAKQPRRTFPLELQQRASSLVAYGVAFHACGNTLKSLKWTKDDLLPFAKVVPIGVEDIMLLQEKGFSYFSW